MASWVSLATVPEIARLEASIDRSRPGAAPPERVVGRGPRIGAMARADREATPYFLAGFNALRPVKAVQ